MTDTDRAKLQGFQAAADAIGRRIAQARINGEPDDVMRGLALAAQAVNAESAAFMRSLGFNVAA